MKPLRLLLLCLMPLPLWSEALTAAGDALAVSTPGYGCGAESLYKMCVGNQIGIELAEDVDVEGAIELLKSAGYEFDDNGMQSASTPITHEYLVNESSSHIAIAECFQQELAAVGSSLTIRTCDWNVFLQDRKNGIYDFAREGWIADFNDPINMIVAPLPLRS